MVSTVEKLYQERSIEFGRGTILNGMLRAVVLNLWVVTPLWSNDPFIGVT